MEKCFLVGFLNFLLEFDILGNTFIQTILLWDFLSVFQLAFLLGHPVCMIVISQKFYHENFLEKAFCAQNSIFVISAKFFLQIVPADEISNVMAIYGMLIPITTIGPPVFNLVYKWSLDFAACNSVERGEKDWCSAVFILFGSCLLFINAAIFAYLRVSIGRNR